MRSTAERMEILEKRATEIKKRENRKRRIKITATVYAAAIIVVALMPNLAAYKEHSEISASVPLSAASIFAGNQFSEYAIIGILAFLLGVFVTIMCNMISKRNRGENEEDGDGR